jgi:copper(I)-binding protein
MRHFLLPALLLCAGTAQALDILDASVPPGKAGQSVVVSMFLDNPTSQTVVITGAQTPLAQAGKFQRLAKTDDGLYQLQPLSDVTLPPHTNLVFAPGALELRLLNLQADLSPGYEIPLTLHFTPGGPRTLRLKIGEH